MLDLDAAAAYYLLLAVMVVAGLWLNINTFFLLLTAFVLALLFDFIRVKY